MRLRERDLKTVYLKKRIAEKDEEANEIVGYAKDPIKLTMNVQSAGGSTNAQIYGSKLPYIKSCKYQGDELKEGQNELDGLCICVESDQEPDFKILAIQTFSTHLNITIERIDIDGRED